MAGRDEIAALMEEVGATPDDDETVARPERDAWRIDTADGVDLLVTYEALPDRLTFAGGLGRPHPTLRDATYALLLTYNGQSLATGGGLIGLTAPEGELTLRLAVPAARLEADSLRGLIMDLLEVAGGWRAYVRREPGTPPAADPDLHRFQLIRG